MTSKLEEAAITYCKKEKDYTVTFSYNDEGYPELGKETIQVNSHSVDAFKACANWLLSEAQALAFPQGTIDQVVRLSDLKKLIGE